MSSNVPIKEFHLDLSELTFTGHDLVRPESIIAQRDGTLWVSDGRGGITRIAANGQQQFFAGLGGEPNGLAMQDDGTILIANIGTGTIQKMLPDGTTGDFLTEVDGFTFDAEGNVWVTTVLRNGVGIITHDGDYHVVFEEANEPLLATFDQKIADGQATPADMAATVGKTLQLITSVTFGGPDLQRV